MTFGMKGKFLLFVCLAAEIIQLVISKNSTHISYLNFDITKDTWTYVKDTVRCWSSTGHWKFNASSPDPRTVPEYSQFNKICSDDISPQYGNASMKLSRCDGLLNGNATKYYWTSSTCRHSADTFDADGFCHLMKGFGNVMVVGDAVSMGASQSWRNYIARQLNVPCSSYSSLSDQCNGVKLMNIRNDKLSLVTDNSNSTSGEYPWVNRLNEMSISLLILNRGAHYESDDILLQSINQTLYFLKVNYPHISVVWRNTPYGNIKYKDDFYSAPLQHQPLLLWHHELNYGKFQHQNELVKLFLEHHYEDVLYVDVATPTYYRVDSHIDKLHICPALGHMETWLDLIYSAIVLIKVASKRHLY